MPATLSPEYWLLTQAASPVPSADPTPGPLDWNLVLSHARRHRLRPLLARHLETTGIGAPGAPDEVVAELTLARRRTAASNLRLLAGARPIVATLSDAGVPVMALKGQVLLEQAYPDISLRPMADLDFLVSADAIQRAEDLLIGLGYRSRRPVRPGEPGPRVTKYAYPELVSPDGLVYVDLHRHVLADARFDIAEFWAHARPSGDGSQLVPDGEDLLLHLAGHFFKDRVRRSAGSLGQLADIAWTVHATPVDWDILVARAATYGLHGRVFLALMATNELVAPVVPAEVLDALRPASYSAAAGRTFVARRLLGDAVWHPPGYFGGLPATAFSARRRPLRRIFPDREYLELAYGQEAGAGSSYRRLLLVRARRVLPRLRPWKVYRDVRLNRWMRSVAEEAAPASTKA